MTKPGKMSTILAAGFLLALPGNSRAAFTTILDQIGPNPRSSRATTPTSARSSGRPTTR